VAKSSAAGTGTSTWKLSTALCPFERSYFTLFGRSYPQKPAASGGIREIETVPKRAARQQLDVDETPEKTR
jgi:hypothetical protein